MIALYPGAFKPPHRGHFNVVKSLLDGTHNGHIYDKDSASDAGSKALSGESGKLENIDKVIVFIGGGERNGITKEISKAIWDIYSKYLSGVEIKDGQKNPMFAAKDYAKENPDEKFFAITGVRSDDDFKDLRRITTFKNTPNVSGLVVAGPGEQRATKFREAILSGNLDIIKEFFPSELKREEMLKILNMLKQSIISETMDSTIEELFSNWFDDKIEEGSSGTPIAPRTAVPSKDRAKLVTLYNRIKNQIESPGVKVTFENDHIRVGLEYTPDRSDFDFTPYMGSILEYMLDNGMKISPLPEIKLKKDIVEATDFFGRTAYYDPSLKEIVVYTQSRHPKDIMRSFTHEMIHHMQNLEGRLIVTKGSDTNEDKHLLELEKEAYLKGNITFRNWEDKIKKENK